MYSSAFRRSQRTRTEIYLCVSRSKFSALKLKNSDRVKFSIYVYIYIHMYVYVCIYIYRDTTLIFLNLM